jgi:hypothetical protein
MLSLASTVVMNTDSLLAAVALVRRGLNLATGKRARFSRRTIARMSAEEAP